MYHPLQTGSKDSDKKLSSDGDKDSSSSSTSAAADSKTADSSDKTSETTANNAAAADKKQDKEKSTEPDGPVSMNVIVLSVCLHQVCKSRGENVMYICSCSMLKVL